MARRRRPESLVATSPRHIDSPPMSSSALQEIRIGLLWHSINSGNLGVGALTESNILLARRALERAGLTPRFTTVGFRDEAGSYASVEETVRIDGRFLLNPAGYWRTLQKFDCLLDIGGGDSFSDLYGPKRFAYLWLTKALAIARKKPLLLSPQTIGPFTGKRYRKLARRVMEGADAVFARDTLSMAAIRDIAPGARAFQSIDVAFALPYTPAEPVPGRLRVAVNVSGLLFNRGLERVGKHRLGYDYAALARRLIAALLAEEEVQVQLFCHVSAPEQPGDDDSAVADQLAREFPAVVRVPAFSSPSAAKSYISGVDFVIAGRMHACIAAYSAGVPFVATAYSRKFSGLFGMLEYPAILAMDRDTGSALSFILAQLRSRDELRTSIRRGSEQIEMLLDRYETYLQAFFTRASKDRKAVQAR